MSKFATRNAAPSSGQKIMLGIAAFLACLPTSEAGLGQDASSTTAATQSAAAKKTTASINFNLHIAPIIHEKCSSCHRPDQVGPFPLLTYQQVADRAQTIQAVIEDQYMPPWKPVNQNVHFANDRRLSDQQKQQIANWIKAGKPEGPASAKPATPQFPDKWMLGEPDLVVKMNGRFEVPASGPDIYRSFVFPLDLPEDKWVKAVELRPSAKSSVHHGLFFVDTAKSARKMDEADDIAGIQGMSFLSFDNAEEAPQANSGGGILNRLKQFTQRPTNSRPADRVSRLDSALARGLGGYVPGAMPAFLPDDLALFLPAGSDVVMQTHFHPSGKVEFEQAELALYFADKAPSQQLVPIQVPSMFGFGVGIDVPAGEKDYVVEDSFEIPIDVQGISIGGHAHYICREMSLIAHLPDNSIKTLLQIDDWDLDWQDRYYFAERVELPAGTVLKTRLVYDNSSDNPENPNSPPQRIKWGRQSEDEMGSVTLAVVAKDEQQRSQLEAALREKFRESVVAKFQSGNGMLRLLKQLDSNGDQMLQLEEAPPRLSKHFSLFDTDRNQALDAEELKRVAEVMKQLRSATGN